MGIVTECRHGHYLYGNCLDCNAERKGMKTMDWWIKESNK